MFVRQNRFIRNFIRDRYSVTNCLFYSTKSKTKDTAVLVNTDPFDLFNNFNDNETVQYHPTAGHLKCLNKKFQLDNFKPLQWTTISSILNEKQDIFAMMPTGFGKSLCYQYPAVYTKSLSIVISPLISLMQDQVKFLENLKIPACYIGPAQSDPNVIKKVFCNHYRIIYITPETALSEYGIKLLQELNHKTKIVMIAVDEAHCILQWGNSFRPAYKNLGILRAALPSIPMLALTGTATSDEKYGIFHLLGLKNPNVVEYSLNRPSLYYMARQMSKEPYGDITQVLMEDVKKFNIEDGSVIIYCLTKKKTEKVASILNKMGLKCDFYHSGLNNASRKNILNAFLDGELKVIVATTAFGMGINKQGVRVVVHYGTPLSMEGYYQEVGRAGRDGKLSLCVLYYSQADFFIHRYINKKNIKSHLNEYNAELRNNTMKKYVSLTTCRRKFILDYFDNSFLPTTSQNCCDNCVSNRSNMEYTQDLTSDVELLLDVINHFLPITFGMKHLISILIGSQYAGSNKSSKYFGKGFHRSETWWNELVFLLEIENYVKITSSLVGSALFTKLELHYKGKSWLSDRSRGIIQPIEIKFSKRLQELSESLR